MKECGSSHPKVKTPRPFGIKWPDEPIKPLDYIIQSLRVLSICGKVTITKSLIVPKLNTC